MLIERLYDYKYQVHCSERNCRVSNWPKQKYILIFVRRFVCVCVWVCRWLYFSNLELIQNATAPFAVYWHTEPTVVSPSTMLPMRWLKVERTTIPCGMLAMLSAKASLSLCLSCDVLEGCMWRSEERFDEVPTHTRIHTQLRMMVLRACLYSSHERCYLRECVCMYDTVHPHSYYYTALVGWQQRQWRHW